MAKRFFAVLLVLCGLLSMAAPPRDAGVAAPFPKEAAGWRARGAPADYDRTTVYDYLDGGAEVYLEYGLRRLSSQRYARPEESPIVFDLFEMDAPAGAFGAFTFEREDEEAGIGQGSEYGGGLLRFWRGRWFGFVQAEAESPASKAAVLALGRSAAERLGPDAEPPALPGALPPDGLRARSVRFVLSPLLLQIREPFLEGNPLGLTPRCEAAVGRYGERGGAERVVLARFPDAASAERGVNALVAGRFPAGAKAGEARPQGGGWSCAKPCGPFAVVVLESPSEARAKARMREAEERLREVAP